MSFLVTIVAIDLGDIFYFFFDGAGVNTRYRRVVATNLSLSSTALETLLVVLILF